MKTSTIPSLRVAPELRAAVESVPADYVLLFEIDNVTTVTILAVRHQREDDYH